MKKLIVVLFVSCAFAACGNKTDKKDATGETQPATEKKEAAAEAKVSPEMTAFIGKFNGTSDAVAAAIKQYAVVDTLDDADMGIYSLKDPKITAINGDCYTVEAGAGMTLHSFEVCWEKGKIKSIADKGMK